MNIVNYLKALSDITRLRLINILLHYEVNVNEIAAILGMSQPRISRHLKILLDSGLVHSRRDGLWVFYSVPDNGDGRSFIESIKSIISSEKELKQDIENSVRIVETRSSETTRFFDRVAGDWTKLKQDITGDLDINKLIAQHMKNCKLAADIGCGTGDLIPALLAHANKVVGVDKSQKMLEQAKRLLSAEADRLSLRLGDLEHLPLGDSEADFAVANMVLHHLSSPHFAIEEIYRVLKRKGKFVIVDFLKHSNEQMRTKYNDRWLGFEPEEMVKWLRTAKFIIKDATEFKVKNSLTINLILAVKQ